MHIYMHLKRINKKIGASLMCDVPKKYYDLPLSNIWYSL